MSNEKRGIINGDDPFKVFDTLGSGCAFSIVLSFITISFWFRVIDWLEVPLIFIIFPFLQKLILYAYNRHNYKWWLRASFLGIVVAYLMAFLFRDLLLSSNAETNSYMKSFLSVIFYFGGGAFLIMSFFQWLVLRRYTQYAWDWLAFNVMAIIVATVMVMPTQEMGLESIGLTLWSIAVYGLIIGIGLAWVAYLPLREKSKAKRGI